MRFKKKAVVDRVREVRIMKCDEGWVLNAEMLNASGNDYVWYSFAYSNIEELEQKLYELEDLDWVSRTSHNDCSTT